MSETTSTGSDQTPDTGGTAVQVEAAPAKTAAIVGRSPGQLAWIRLKRDRTAMVSIGILAFFVLMAAFAEVIEWIYGVSAEEQSAELISSADSLPLGYLGGVDFTSGNASHQMHILGVVPGSGQDIFMQLVYGSRVSLIIALTSSLVGVGVGVVVGIFTAYFSGWVDKFINWFIDFMLAFPFLIFGLAAVPVINSHIADAKGGIDPVYRVMTIIAIFTLFGWMATARLIRGQVLSLREREYIEAAKAAGAGTAHILFKQLLPNLWAPILVTLSLTIPATVAGEAGLSFLGIGVDPPTPDWGRMINDSLQWFAADPMYMLVPGIALFLLVLAFNLFGDALRDALDPKSTR